METKAFNTQYVETEQQANLPTVGGYSIPAIPTQSTENEGRVGRAGMPYPPTYVAFNPYN